MRTPDGQCAARGPCSTPVRLPEPSFDINNSGPSSVCEIRGLCVVLPYDSTMTTHFDCIVTDRAGGSESPIGRRDPLNPTLFRLCFAPNRQSKDPVITISDCPLDAENFLSPSFERQGEGMPPKRERERDELDEGGSSTTSAPSKKQARAVRVIHPR